MYDIVEIAANQKVPSADLTAIGQLGRAGQTALARHVVGEGMSWADFTFAVSGLTVTVSDGFLLKAGGQYKTASATPVPLATLTPPSAGLKRIISIVAFANPSRPDASEPREFAMLVTPATPSSPATYQTETRTTSTRNRQVASIAAVAGDIAPQPTPPVVGADQCEIARIVLLAGSIESVTPITKNRTPNLSALQLRVDGHDAFIDGVGSRLDTIDKNLSTLSANQPPPTSENTLRQALSNLALLNEMTKAKTGDVAYGYEVGLDMRHTDNTVSGYAATVSDGIRFPWVASKERPFTLYTPGDNAVKIVGGLMLPDFDEETRIAVDGKDGESNISNQVHSVTTAIKRTISRSSVSYGPAFTVCNNTAYWQSGNYNAAAGIFQREGEVFTAAATGVDFGAPVGYAPGTHIEMRLQQQWTDSWTEEYWDYVTETFGIDGTLKGQTFKVPDFGYLTSIELPFTRKDAAFGVTLLLTETVIGQPSIKRVIEKVTLAAADIVADPGGTVRTKFAFRPVLTDPGKLYAWATVTKGNYALATVTGNKFAQGSSFDSTDNGEWFQGSTTIDYAFRANFAKFKATRVEVRMNDIDNVSGNTISALKYLYGSVIPAGGRIIHRVRKEGGAWTTAAEVNKNREAPLEIASGPFASNPLPVSVQQTVILVGTQTLMPAIDLNQAWVTSLKLGTVLNHFTESLNLGASCNRAEVQVTLDGPFIPANHTAGCNLLVGGSLVAPTGSSVKIDPDKPGKRVVTYTFTFAAASSFRINLTGTLATILSAYHVDNRFFRAWAV